MTQEQQKVAVLVALGFKSETTTPGAAMKYEITSEVIDSLTSKKGKRVVIGSDGSVQIE